MGTAESGRVGIELPARGSGRTADRKGAPYHAPVSDLFVINLAAALAAAAVGGLLAYLLRLPVMVGYIAAGIVFGPFTPGPVLQQDDIRELADLGVIFLMFAVGLEINLRELLRHGKLAISGALAQVGAMLGLGALAGIVGLFATPIAGLFFGGVTSNSSSTIIAKVMGDDGSLTSEPGQIGMAWSTIQDLTTVALIVLLPTIATGTASAEQVLVAVATAAIFVAVAGPLGAWLLPKLLGRLDLLRSRELFLVGSVALALVIAVLAGSLGVSAALGAFMAGAVIGESGATRRLLRSVIPLRDIFASLFFVSIGLLLNPLSVVDDPGMVLLTLVAIVLVKGALVFGLVWLVTRRVALALLAAAIISQSAEFSFILTSAGVASGGITQDLGDDLLAGVTLSIVLAPFLYRWALRLARRLEPEAPPAPEPGTQAAPA